jgi:hypothetical protein
MRFSKFSALLFSCSIRLCSSLVAARLLHIASLLIGLVLLPMAPTAGACDGERNVLGVDGYTLQPETGSFGQQSHGNFDAYLMLRFVAH